MPADAATEVKARLDIVEVIGGYVRLQRSGRDHKGLCPFHSERTPSFNVSQERQAWHCFGCGEGGDVFTFVMKMERIDFRQALELLAERAGVELSAGPPGRRSAGKRRRRILELNAAAQAFFDFVLWTMPAGEAGRRILAERGVAESVARRFGIGFAPAGGAAGDALLEYLRRKGHGTVEEAVAAGLAHPPDRGPARDRFRNRLVFPIRDERGQILGFGARAIGDAQPKYLNTPATDAFDKSAALFGLDLAREAIGEAGIVLVVEGYFDVVAAHIAGVRNAVASCGTALTAQQVQRLGRLTRAVCLCFDADDAGRTAASKAVDVIAAAGLEGRVATLPGGAKDPDEAVRRDPAAFSAVVAAAPREWQALLDAAIGDAESGSLEERRAAAERAVAVVARIPEATARNLYAEQAARRLDIDPSAVVADATRARRAGAGRPPRPVAAISPEQVAAAQPAGDTGARDGAVEPPPDPIEAYLGALLLQRPELTGDALGEGGLRSDELRSASLRRLLELASACAPGEAFPLHRVAAGDQPLASRLLLRALPELGPDAAPGQLRRALEDAMWSCRQGALLARIREVRRERRLARDAGRAADEVRLAVQLQQLYADRQRLGASRRAGHPVAPSVAGPPAGR